MLACQFQHFGQQRNALAGVLRVKPRTGVETPQPRQRPVGEPAVAIGGAREAGIVEADELSVAAEAEIGFDGVGSLPGGKGEGSQGVFRGNGGGTAVSDEEGAGHLTFSFYSLYSRMRISLAPAGQTPSAYCDG